MNRLCTVMAVLLLASNVTSGQAADAPSAGQSTITAPAIKVERIVIHSPGIAGNLEGNRADRDVWVALPPSYDKSPLRRYPVVYALHGYTMTPEKWFSADKLEQRIAAAFGAGAREMIVVFPNAHSVHDGSMYSSSVTSGDWESFITRDVVNHIDKNYRTFVDRRSRGLMGHSMGGYGTLRLGMKYPEVFSSLYAMSGCCLSARDITADIGRKVEAVKTQAAAQVGDFMTRATFATASAWSPNPGKPPFYVDLPTVGGIVQPRVLAEWAANAPLAMVPQYVHRLRRYTSIAIDVGDRDGLIGDNTAFHDALDRFGIEHTFEIYPGDHGSGVATRFESKVIPYFSKTLRFEP